MNHGRGHLILFLFFLENRARHFMKIVSFEDFSQNVEPYFLQKKKKKKKKMVSLICHLPGV